MKPAFLISVLACALGGTGAAPLEARDVSILIQGSNPAPASAARGGRWESFHAAEGPSHDEVLYCGQMLLNFNEQSPSSRGPPKQTPILILGAGVGMDVLARAYMKANAPPGLPPVPPPMLIGGTYKCASSLDDGWDTKWVQGCQGDACVHEIPSENGRCFSGPQGFHATGDRPCRHDALYRGRRSASSGN